VLLGLPGVRKLAHRTAVTLRVQEDGSVLRVTLSDGTAHRVVHPEGVTAKKALEDLLTGPGGGWFYTGNKTWIRRDAVIRVVLEDENAG
jgi:hypothetical protein